MDIPKKIISDKLKGTLGKKDVLFKIKDSSIVWEKLSPEVQEIINSAGGVTTAEITDYMTLGGDLLPMASVFTYEGMPVSHLRTEQFNATVWDLVFCVCHKDGLENLGNLYVHYDWESPMEGWAFVQSFDNSTAPSWILRLFNEAEATTSNSGLMSSGDKTKLNALPTSQELANTLASLVDGGSYDSVNKTIDFKHGNTILFSIDATAFIKDGMVDSVTISDGYFVITFNTDAGKEAISLALTDIFNPANYYDKTAVDNLLASKQDSINDLATIRSGAAAGATAVQPAELVPINTTLGEVENALTEEVAETADVEDDASGQVGGTWIRPQSTPHISFTRNMQANTITSQTIDGVSYSSGVSFGVYNQYDILHISSGGSVVFYVIGNSTYYSSPSIRVAVKYQGEESFTIVKTVNLPTTSYGIKFSIEVTGECDIALYYFGSGSAQPTYTMGLLVRIDYNVSALIDVSEVKDDVSSNTAAITAIEQKIPAQASPNNKLVDEDSMNSSIATATATFRGAFNLVTDLHLSVSATHAQIATALVTAIQTADSNDYCFVQIPVADATPTEIASVERYKFNGTRWEYEYTLNNSGYTAAQWAAINSGITSGLVSKLSDLPTATELATVLAGKASTQQLADKEDITPIEAVASGTTAITAQANKYYEVAGTVSSLTVTLPTPTVNTEVTMVVVHLTVGASPTILVTSAATVAYSAAYAVVANKEYELSCLYNGSKWIVSSMEVAV